MRLILFHPGISRIDCRDCVARLYDYETGRPKEFESGPHRTKRFLTAKEGHKPQCRLGKACPKGTPETSHLVTLSERNLRAFQHFIKRKATGFISMTDQEKEDPIVAGNFAVLDGIWREYERVQGEESNAAAFGQIAQIFGKR